ncbi:MAG: TIGR03435 family protein [Acidobacteriota bacterium]|nr:TIGR03435 family protein [Acidobacteriota bacterium]
MQWIWGCLAGLLAAAGLCGQSPAVPSFEVASVRPAGPDQRSVDFVLSPGGRLKAVNVTLAQMVREAYQVKYYQVAGGPGWMDNARFNIEAKAAGEPGRQEMMAMLRTLLIERFRLQARREMREGNVFELVLGKGGPKLTLSTAGRSYIHTIRNTPLELPGVSYTLDGRKASMALLADELKGWVQRPVFDRTGITGEYDFQIEFAIEGHLDAGPSLFTALQEQLRLKLQAAKGPIETLVIEKAEKPGEN